jgi:hypothetical protein
MSSAANQPKLQRGWRRSRAAEAQFAARNVPQTEMATAAGMQFRLSIQAGREGIPLLLINGIGAPLELWEPFRGRLGMETIAFGATRA